MKLLDFLNILAFLTLFTGVVTFIDILLHWIFKPIKENKKTNVFLEYCRAFFPVLLLVLCIRSFAIQPYRVPTGSLEPTVKPGDFILVTQYNYGLKIPFWDHTIIKISHPKMGQIALFQSPVNPTQLTLVKRVIGLPGDRISYINKVLYINGQEEKQSFVKNTKEILDNGNTVPVKEYREDLNGVSHLIIINPKAPTTNFKNLIVPKDEYFMMGDNRDDSDDSRYWGFVPFQNFIGQARLVFFNMTFLPFHIDLHRIGKMLSPYK